MKSQLPNRLAWAVLACAVLAGCDAFVPRSALPELLPGAVMIATNDADPGASMNGLCQTGRAIDPVVGLLDGDPTAAPYSTWLATPTGQRVIVLWPRGFSARFQPDLELISRSNTVVARRGEPIDLNMGWKESGGTVENPYRPSWVNSGCYAPVH